MYFIIRLSQVSTQAEEWLSDYVFENGALGMSEALSYEPKPNTDEVRTVAKDLHTLDVYFQEAPDRTFFEEIKTRYPEISFEQMSKEEEDWMEGWKKNFKSFELIEGVWVVPSWLEAPAAAKTIIRVDPGMAFGTGTHETTSMMSHAVNWISKQSPNRESLIDVGTGTGLLAILADVLGYKTIAATDTDKESQRVSIENFEINKVKVAMSEKQLESFPNESFDVVLANIIHGVLVLIKDDLLSRIKPGGYIAVSGILKDDKDEFVQQFTLPKNIKWVHNFEAGEWVALVAKKDEA